MGSEASIPVRVSAQAGASPEPAALASAAHALCDAGRTMEAEAIARWLVQQHPQFSGGRIALGRVLFEQDRLTEAADVLRATTIQYPASVAAYRWLAEVLVRQGLWARARAVLNQASLLSPANRRIGQLQRLAGQSAERGVVAAEDSTTRAMNLPPRQPPPLPPLPAQGLSRTERRNGLSEEDPTPAGVAPPETPLYARADFVAKMEEASAPTPLPTTDLVPAPARRATLEWPAAPVIATVLRDPSYRESAVINVLAGPTGEPTAVERTPSVTWKGIPMLDRHWRRRWHKGAGLALSLLATAGAGFAGLWLFKPTPAPQPPSLAKHVTKVESTDPAWLNNLLEGSPATLLATIDQAGAVGNETGAVIANLAQALLLVDYGLTPATAPPEPPTTSEPNLADAHVAAQALLALGKGQLEQARALVQGQATANQEEWWLPLAQARLFQRMGNADAARQRLEERNAEAAPLALLAAELALDDGRPSVALQRLSVLAKTHARHPRLASLTEEARDALAITQPTQLACDEHLPPNLRLGCMLRAASHARRTGRREAALTLLQKASADDVTDPRVLGKAVVALANVGLGQRSGPFVDRLHRLTAPAFSGRAWADVALALTAGPAGAADETMGTPVSPETRLLAARAAYARGGAQALAATLTKMGDAAIAADDDLRWWRLLTRYDGAEAGRMSVKLMRSRKELGPVGTFIAGLLAANSRHLTAHWMALALAAPGHGDRCWAASFFAQAQRNLGEDPASLADYRNLMAAGICTGGT